MTCVENKWNMILSEYDNRIDKYSANLNVGANEQMIVEAEREIKVSFPEELKALYRCNNGDTGKLLVGSILGLKFLSLEELVKEWEIWCRVIDTTPREKLLELNSFASSIPKGKIKCVYANKLWIPFSHDFAGNHIGLDLDPDINGVFGQVITFGRDEDEKLVLADSLIDFLDLMLEIIRSNDFKIIEYSGEKVFELNGKLHTIDYFKSRNL